MKSNALKKTAHINGYPPHDQVGVVTHVSLNAHDVACIELALQGFAQCIHDQHFPEALAGFDATQLSAQLRYLQCWFNQPALKAQLRLDGSNSVLWPFTSSELVDWLSLVCGSCITKDAILIAAANAARHEYAEFTHMYSENVTRYSLADYLEYSNFSACQCYYHDIVDSCQGTLLGKLAALKAADYPLFP